MAVTIAAVKPKSICFRHGVRAGEMLMQINGHEIVDILDYQFYATERRLTLTLRSTGGKYREIRIKKDEYEDLGLTFDTYLMDRQRHCANKCVFCFIDQLPKGMRESLYFKDDDSRLSFLFGNYVTLTNLSEREVERIIQMHISPVNISVHTMNPDLRVKMMKNPRAGESLQIIKRFADAGIKMNTQLVLCPGLNDGDELLYSLTELGKLYPAVQSIAAVPLGMTKYREGLQNSRRIREKAPRRLWISLMILPRIFSILRGHASPLRRMSFTSRPGGKSHHLRPMKSLHSWKTASAFGRF